VNAQLQPYEVPKGLLLEPEAFTEANGRLTPTQKLKRHAVQRDYRAALIALCERLDAEVKFVEVVDNVLALTDSSGVATTDLKKKNFFQIGGDSLSGI
jgi:hypothetical protein